MYRMQKPTPLEELVEAAVAWWRMKKPGTWTDAQYLREPEVNSISETEKRLSRAVSAAIQEADSRWKVTLDKR